MPIRDPCFFSYRHLKPRDSPDPLSKRLLEEIYAKLGEGFQDVWATREVIYRDVSRQVDDDNADRDIAKGLYESACMVMLYTPNYFDIQNTFCAREYRAMLTLEAERIDLLPEDLRKHGLIMPVVLKCTGDLPDIVASRAYADMRGLPPHEWYFPRKARERYHLQISRVCSYILRCYDAFSKLSPDPFCNSSSFRLPGERETAQWLQEQGLASSTT